MPEGPSIVILKESLDPYKGKKVLAVAGSSKAFDLQILKNKTVTFKTWGKHFLICFPKFTVRIHFLLFGSYLINERKTAKPRLTLQFSKGEVNFYACSVQLIEKPLDEVYDWSADVMNKSWSDQKALDKLKEVPDMLVCDAILDQHIFSGAGNIFKNEVLFRIRVHPASKTGHLPAKKRKELVQEVVKYAFDFLKWKKEYVLKKHWQVHTKKECPRCRIPLHKAHLGKTKRRTFFCENCQKEY
ncbi:endonuclease [Pseudobacter ginsenosidimutans]|uniref:Endonuclease-8 n=1 Tax=Pseudobacter ginsenosidimutans TaxID=661488 RepID=A0A4V2EZN8_9BACT|nr:endonuclease [Pseudobacter ginsenosidimutans]QEC45592.1 endonuclease [Pseudobacter ginsenosidimutans]RZS67140.1 endonuclease-8 [Pseudobacter ginsenosidimutans]